MNNPTVTVVKVKAPWFYFPFLLNRAFRKTIPQYQKVEGLAFKYYSVIHVNGVKYFGGIYLWDSKAQAEKWFSPAWFAYVRQKRKTDGKVVYYDLQSESAAFGPNFDYRKGEGKTITLILHNLHGEVSQHDFRNISGLLRTYLFTDAPAGNGAVLLFVNASAAKQFLRLKTYKQYEWFETPVLLNNRKA